MAKTFSPPRYHARARIPAQWYFITHSQMPCQEAALGWACVPAAAVLRQMASRREQEHTGGNVRASVGRQQGHVELRSALTLGCCSTFTPTMTDRLLHLLQELASRFSSPAATAEEAFEAGPPIDELEGAAAVFHDEAVPRVRQ